jgi:hypothetical protein
LLSRYGISPHQIIAELLFSAATPFSALAVFKSATSVQDVPSQISVTAEGVGVPPTTIALVCDPEPSVFLPVFKSPTSVQLVPFQVSLFALRPTPGLLPPEYNPAVEIPVPDPSFLAVLSVVGLLLQEVPFQISVFTVG